MMGKVINYKLHYLQKAKQAGLLPVRQAFQDIRDHDHSGGMVRVLSLQGTSLEDASITTAKLSADVKWYLL